VDSQVVKIRFFPRPDRVAALPDYDRVFFKKIVDAAFQQRRKTLINALSASNLVGKEKKCIEASLEKLGLDIKIRGERLRVEEFIALTNILQQYQNT
jgi:16S rRNA (adenine1518-N6/adenine1519-N6)-dimethyltransferase